MENRAPVRIGMLTPSSNTVVEPLVAAMLTDVPEVTAHVSRLRVTEISLEDDSQSQFEPEPMLAAAELLADARVSVLGWNGTSASWLGFDFDHRLCETMTARFGVPSTSAVLAVNELTDELGVRRIALLTPYVDEVQARIVAQYSDAGYDCIAERHVGERVNYAFAEIDDDVIIEQIGELAVLRPDAIIVMCTNMHAAHLVDALEHDLDVPIIDSLAAYLWKALRLAEVDTARITGWGRIFRCKGNGA